MFMWSASASDSSIVIGPTSRRMRPRLSRRRVRSRGSSARSVASRSTSTAASLFRRRFPERLRPAAAALTVEPTLVRGFRALRRDARTWDSEGGPQLLHEALDGQLSVAKLAPLVLCDCAQHRPGSRDDALLLRV